MPPPRRQGFSLDLIRFALQFLMDGLSLRQVEVVLGRLGAWLGFDAPDHSTVRLWVQRVGLYLWQRTPPRADDWIWILDHVAESGGGKCLLIVGVRQSDLRDRDFVLEHTDVTLLYAETMQTSSGDAVFGVLKKLAETVGVPVQIVSDHGSDALKGERLFQALHPTVTLTWDITHRSARLLAASLKGDATWAAFKTQCQQVRMAVARTPWAALAPPSTTGASRCEHFDKLTLWGEQTLERLDAGAAGAIDGEHAWDVAASEALGDAISEGDRQRLQPLLGRSFPDAATFTTAVQAALGPNEHTAALVRESDRGQRRCRQQFGWLEKYRAALRDEYVPLVRQTYSAEKQVKHAGLHGGSAAEWRASQPPLPRGRKRARDFRAGMLRYLRVEGGDRRREGAMLATSDVVESLFGKYKRYTERSPQAAMNSAILTLPVATETLTSELIERALESTPLKTLNRWCQKTFGRTRLALQRYLATRPPAAEPA